MRARVVASTLFLGMVAAVSVITACELAFPTKLESGPACSDTQSDAANCGACGNACDSGVACFHGICDGKHAVQVSAGLHACAVVKAGSVFCWGSNLFGETGSDPATDRCADAPCITAPKEVAGLTDVVEVRAGYYSTCARKSDGTVWCWGRNDFGQLGGDGGAHVCGSARCDYVPRQVAGLSDVTAIDVGNGFACALDKSGALRCWGDDTYGTLGNGTSGAGSSSATPVLVQTPGPFSHSSVTAISTGLGAHACALLKDSQVACWGRNDLGALGHDPALDTTTMKCRGGSACSGTPTLADASASAVRAANQVTCALFDDAGVSCWGDDGLGQFGNGRVDVEAGVHATPQPGPMQSFVAIDGRYAFELALDGTGKVYAWGSSSRGAIGNGSIEGVPCRGGSPCAPVPTVVPTIEPYRIVQVSAGVELALALQDDGTVWAWGANVDGRLGHRPGTSGDALTCAPTKDEICNPLPSRVPGFP